VQSKPAYAERTAPGNALAGLEVAGGHRAFRTALQSKPDFAEAHCHLAVALLAMARAEQWSISSRRYESSRTIRRPKTTWHGCSRRSRQWRGNPVEGDPGRNGLANSPTIE